MVTSMYIIAVDINFTACKIMLNNLVKNIMVVGLFQLITLKNTQPVKNVCSNVFGFRGGGYIPISPPMFAPVIGLFLRTARSNTWGRYEVQYSLYYDKLLCKLEHLHLSVRYTYVQSTKVRYRTCYYDTQLLFNYDVKNIWIFLSSICDFRTLLYWGRITITAETDLIITVNRGVKTGTVSYTHLDVYKRQVYG